MLNIFKSDYVAKSAMWFGCAISVAEILTGTFAAPLGVVQGLTAVILGHILGCSLLFAMAYLGAESGQNAMNSVKLGFGKLGGAFFAILNILQLFGWASVMVYNGALAVDHGENFLIYSFVIAALIILWLIFIRKGSFIVNTITVALLGLICLFLTITIFSANSAGNVPDTGITFGQVVEISATMPISWLPVIADYTNKCKKPFKISLAATLAYFIAGVWMYVIGMFAMLNFGAEDIYEILHILPFVSIATVIIIGSTVVNTFVDGLSASESFSTLSASQRIQKLTFPVSIVVIALSFFIANLMTNSFLEVYEQFLYLIGAVFAPMASVLIVKCIFLGQNSSEAKASPLALISWLVGFVTYEILLNLGIDTFVGISIPASLLTMGIYVMCFRLSKIATK